MKLNTEVILFKMDTCGHCIKFLPEWKKLNLEFPTEGNIKLMEVNANDTEMCKKYGVDGFPTIIFRKSTDPVGTGLPYEGNRTFTDVKNAILKFKSEISGGSNKYKLKYLKYKTKYLSMKNI